MKYLKYCKLFKKIIKLTKRAQNNHKILTSHNKTKTAWRIINAKRLNTPKESIDIIKIDKNNVLNNPTEIVNAFNNYFIEKVKPLPGVGKKVTSLIDHQLKSMFLAPSTPYQIYKIINNLKNTNSVGYDGVSTKIIKAVNEDICHHLSHILNLSISTGIFPQDLKLSIIKPLFKKDCKQSMVNYRPIALYYQYFQKFSKSIFTANLTHI